MGGRYLTELAAVIRAAGCVTVEYAGWTTRANGSGGFDGGRPWGVMWHHTASATSPEADAAYIVAGSDIAPISNLMVDRAGMVWVLAAGCTNTNGSGGPWTFTRGGVAPDCMNAAAVSIEICNSGVGEPYPQAQIDATFAASVAITTALGVDPADVCTHAAWTFAAGSYRKIDPATADAVTGPWRPRAVNASGTWNVDDLRAECTRRAGAAPTPEPEGDPVIFRTTATADAIFAQGSDMNIRHVSAYEGAVAAAAEPGWADDAPTLALPSDVTDWLSTL